MRRAGLDVTVACPRVRERAQRDIAFVDRLRAEGVTVVEVPLRYGLHPLADLRDCGRLVRLIQQGRYDLVHAHSSKAGVLARLAARLCRVPVVYTPNAFAFLGAQSRFRRWLYRSVEQWLGRTMTDMLVCVSSSEMALADRWAIAPSGRMVTIENAIDPAHYAPITSLAEAKSDLGLDPERLVVGYVGRLEAQKGIEYMLQAAQQVLASKENVQFVLAGEGKLERAARQMVASLGIEGQVLLLGYRTDIPQVLAALDVFVLPSLYEGLPYTLLEAMAAGRAVVATDVVGNRDLVQHGKTGMLVPARQAQALGSTFLHLLSAADERERLGEAAFTAARQRATPDQMAQQVVELYAMTLERRQSKG
jgi:glycosyltransferase involved in cell wall biosynthesis